MLPELVVAHLTGEVVAETTSAGTTGLLDLATGDWSRELCDAIALPRPLLPDILPAGTRVGSWRGVPVHLVGGHDTASAVLGGGRPDEAFVSAGTWLLVGREQAHPDTSAEAQAAGFTNEQGALGGIRFLRNVAGWWLVEECRRGWDDTTSTSSSPTAAAVPDPGVLVDATDERFLAPAEHGATSCAPPRDSRPTPAAPTVVRVAVESMAAATASVIDVPAGRRPGDSRSAGSVSSAAARGRTSISTRSDDAPTCRCRPARSRRRPSATRWRRASRWECSRTRTRRVRHWATPRRSRDERPGPRTARADERDATGPFRRA